MARARTTIAGLALALVLTVLTACAGGPADAERMRAVIVPYHGDEWVMSPNWDDTPRRFVFQHMVRYDDLWCGEPQPGLAERWEHSDDLRVWTVHLNPKHRWHDGVPVTAHDIKFTIDLWNHPDVEYWYGRDVDAVVVLDDHTFRVHHSRPSRMMLDSWIVYYPKHLLEDLDPKEFYRWEFWTRPVGNGPFRYVRHVPKTLIEYEANSDYAYGKPKIDRVVLRFGEGTLLHLLAGDLDVLQSVSPLDAMKLRDDPRFRVYHEEIPGARYVLWKVTDPLFSDARVRRALTHAIDRRLLHRVLGVPDRIPVTDGVYSACQYVERRLPEPLQYDPDAARRLLAEAGWRDTDGDGVLDRDGRALRFTLDAGPGPGEQIAVFVQEQLKRIGVAAEPRALDNALLQDRFRGGDFQAMVRGGPGNGWKFYEQIFGGGSFLGYRNPRVAALFERARLGGPEERDAVAVEIAEILREEMPATYLLPGVSTHIVASRIRGLNDARGPSAFLEKAWIEGGG